MNKKQIIQALKTQSMVRIGVSKTHGVGIFAIKDIKAGALLFEDVPGSGIYITWKEAGKLDPEVKRMIQDFYVWDKQKFLSPRHGLNGINLSFYLNHSDAPNCAPTAKLDFVTLKKIKKGEELTFDYRVLNQPWNSASMSKLHLR